MAWRNCKASIALVNAVNERWPNRSKISDGTIGDAAHASRSSDHNPWVVLNGVGIVRARDITGNGINPAWLAEELRKLGAAGDRRLRNGGYIIYNGRITSPDFTRWNAYNGINPHTKHVHVSFAVDRAGYDDKSDWEFLKPEVVAPPSTDNWIPTEVAMATQRAVNFTGADVDGYWGPGTEHRITLVRLAINRNFGNVKDVQLVVGTAPDGDWGPKSEAALTDTIKKLQAAWGTTADGDWGPATEAAWLKARAENFRA